MKSGGTRCPRAAAVRLAPTRSRPRNKLLASLPPADLARLLPHLRTLPVAPKQVLYRVDEPIPSVVFPNGGVFSITTATRNGSVIENGTVGTEGLVGIELFYGGDVARANAMLQVPDTDAEFLAAHHFNSEMARHGELFRSVQRYSLAFMSLVMQSTACIALHDVQERCCRWLLMTHDRMGRDEFQLSQEFLAMMVGVARPTASVAASALQNAGLISYRHAHMTIIDRKGLEGGSCECYETIRNKFGDLGL